jgi:hypothetical protein
MNRFAVATCLSFALSAVASASTTLSGTCASGGTYSFTVDLDSAVFLEQSVDGPRYTVDPVTFDLCGTSRTVENITIANDTTFACSGAAAPNDFLYFSSSVFDFVVYLEDSTATALSSGDVPASIDRSAYNSTGVDTTQLICPEAGSVDDGSTTSTDPTLLERAEDGRVYGADAFATLVGGTPRQRTAAEMEIFLLGPVARLQAAGCTLDGHAGGAYDPTTLLGEDDGGVLTTTFTPGTKSWSATLTSGDGLSGSYNRNRQAFGYRDDGGFYVGQFVRDRGARGTFYGVTGTCPAGTSYPTVLGSWYRGPFPL